MKTVLPNGWVTISIGDMCALQNGRAFKSSEWRTVGIPIVRIQNLNNPNASYNYFDGEVDDRCHLRGDELLFAWSGTPGTSFGAHIWKGGEAVLNQHIFRIDFDHSILNKLYLKHAINQTLDGLIDTAHGGVGLAHVTKGKFKSTSILLPPLCEQRRIVAKLEALLAKVDTSRQRLNRIPLILKRFRQAVLAAAVEGRLTEEWRQANPQEARTETTLGEVAAEFRTGPFGSSLHQSDYVRDGIPVINPTNIVDGFLVPSRDVTVSGETFGRLSNYALKVGDIIIARRGEMGRCAVIGEKEFGWLCGTGSALVRLKRVAIPAFIQAFISAPSTRQFLIEGSVGSTMANLNQGIFRSVPISLPSVPEQIEILRRLSELNALADQIEARYAKARAQVDRLTQSILAKAFRGELVPQDPKEEPAEVLLARMRGSSAAMAAPAGRRGRPPKRAGR